MEVTLKSWEPIYEDLHNECWSLGWVSVINKQHEREWIVTGYKEGPCIISKGKDLSEAFWKFYDLVGSVWN